MAIDEIASEISKDEGRRTKWLGVYIAVLAVLLAICGVGGSNAAKDASKANLDATNLWAFFQAKNQRRTQYLLAADQFSLLIASQSNISEAARTDAAAKIASYKKRADRYASEPETKEGLKELAARAKALETVRDIALAKDPYFDYGQVALQISIVLASVAIVTGGSLPLVISIILGALGTLMTFNGFYMFADYSPYMDRLAGGLASIGSKAQ